MGAAARQDYERRYRPEDNYRQLMAIYEDVCRQRQKKE